MIDRSEDLLVSRQAKVLGISRGSFYYQARPVPAADLAQMRRIEPYFPLSHGVPRVDDRRVISGIVFVIRIGLRWRDAPREYGPHKTIYTDIPQMNAGSRRCLPGFVIFDKAVPTSPV